MNTGHWSTRKEAISSGWDSPQPGVGVSVPLLDAAGRSGDSGRGNTLSYEQYSPLGEQWGEQRLGEKNSPGPDCVRS